MPRPRRSLAGLLARAAAALTVGAALTACPSRPNQCATSRASNCVAGEVCSFDRKQGCQVCTCRPLGEDLSQPDPDDRSRPPPVRDPSTLPPL